MNVTDNDDYWNESRVTTFNFEREDSKNEDSWLGSDVYNTSKRDEANAGLFVHSFSNLNIELEAVKNYLPEHEINCILYDIADDEAEFKFTVRKPLTSDEEVKLLRKRVKDRWKTPRIEDTVKRIFFGMPFSLELYKSLTDKKKLLQLAVESADGDAILSVVMHLAKTLKKNSFRQFLSLYPTAVSHYTRYLFVRRQMSELSETLEALGKSRESMMKQLFIASQNPNRIQPRLTSISKNYSFETWDRRIIDNFLMLIDWQMEICKKTSQELFIGQSAIEFLKNGCLMRLSLNLPGTTSKTESQIEIFAKKLLISNKQLLMLMVQVNAQIEQWGTVKSLLVTKTWVGGTKLNTTLPANKILQDLRKCGAPPDLLDDVLRCITDFDKRIELARKLERPMVAVDAYVKKKDKSGLLQYTSTLEPLSEHRLYAQQILDKMNAGAERVQRPCADNNLHHFFSEFEKKYD